MSPAVPQCRHRAPNSGCAPPHRRHSALLGRGALNQLLGAALAGEGRDVQVVADEASLTISPAVVTEMLGAPTFLDEEVGERTKKPGVAIGLAWTPAGVSRATADPAAARASSATTRRASSWASCTATCRCWPANPKPAAGVAACADGSTPAPLSVENPSARSPLRACPGRPPSGRVRRHARSAVGVNALPNNIAVEIEMIVELK